MSIFCFIPGLGRGMWLQKAVTLVYLHRSWKLIWLLKWFPGKFIVWQAFKKENQRIAVSLLVLRFQQNFCCLWLWVVVDIQFYRPFSCSEKNGMGSTHCLMNGHEVLLVISSDEAHTISIYPTSIKHSAPIGSSHPNQNLDWIPSPMCPPCSCSCIKC